MTPWQVERDYRAVLTGVYIRADQPLDFAQRSRALGVTYPQGVLAGWSAAALHGYRYVPEDVEPEIVLPAPARRRAGVRLRYDTLLSGESEEVLGYALTSHLRTAYDLGRWLPFDAAIEAVDGLCNIGRRDPKDLLVMVAQHRGDRGLKQLRRVVDLADGGAESPWETRTRLLVVRAGFTKPDTQVLLTDERARLVARVDMAWPQYRVVLEYDGDHHRERGRYSRDVRRRNSVRRLGWDVVVATKELVVRYPDELLERVADALRAGGATELPR
ncbi:endonuclease domain-containing protein [Rhodococcus sp. NPDC058505]|uniref:endonuclease domain-containing protein n=1 Tax=Rhodococcus sp. NPDC058505 TaxID=3346531 RepID=UPI003649C280